MPNEPTHDSQVNAVTVVSIDVLHLDEMGYGPAGNLTRGQWREQCQVMVRTTTPDKWRQQTDRLSKQSAPYRHFGVVLHLSDGQTWTVGDAVALPSTTIDLAGVDIATDLDASNAQFLVPFYAAGARFNALANFHSAHFLAGSCFAGARFWNTSTFTGAQFHETSTFEYTSFAGNVDLTSASFKGETTFGRAAFLGELRLDSTSFSRTANFSRARFAENATFTWIRPSKLWMDNTWFAKRVKFDNVQFEGEANFSHAVFQGAVVFVGSRFHKGANFEKARFSDTTIFRGVPFGGDAQFGSVCFDGPVTFSLAAFAEQSRFEHATFAAAANFENTQFSHVGHFSNAKFNGRSPTFLGVAQKTVLLFRDARFPIRLVEAREVEHYTALKQLSEAQGHTAQALEFNALELQSRCQTGSESALFRSTTWLYALFSDFGRSFSRPLAGLACLIALTWGAALLSAVQSSPPLCPPEVELRWASDLMRHRRDCWPTGASTFERLQEPISVSGWRAAMEYTLLGSLGLFEFAGRDRRIEPINMRLFSQPIEPIGWRLWSVVRGLAGAALVFLFALGLRNNYRIK